jgi:hypothetical protein
MIQGQIFNFESNKLDASKYRNQLKNIGKGSASNQVEPFLIKKKFNFQKLRFSFIKRGNLVDAQLTDSNFRNLSFFLYFENKNLNYIKKIQESFKNKTQDFFKVLNKDLEILESSIKEINTRLNSKYNKVVSYSIFQEKDFEEQYDLFDHKTKMRFRKNDQCDFKRGYIESKETNVSKIDIVSIEVVKEKSFFSDSFTAIEVDADTSLIYRKDKFWKYVVGAKQSLEDLQRLPHKHGELELIINFDGYEDLNNVFIEFGSSLPVSLKEDQIKYFDKKTQSFLNLTKASMQKNSNRLEIVFDTIRTNKIKISLFQKKYHDTSFVYDEGLEQIKKDLLFNRSFLRVSQKNSSPELKRVYDLSILHLECRRKTNSGIGFYREGNPVSLNKPLSLQIKPNIFFKSKNCFIEKYAHIVLYGEEGFAANKIINKNYTSTKRVNVKIPLPNSTYREEELLVLKNKEACLNFYPSTSKKIKDSIKVYRVNINQNQNREELILGADYEVSFNKGSSYVLNENYIPDLDISSKVYSEINSFYIKIKSPEKKYFYVTEYVLNEIISCNYRDKILIKRGELVFNQDFQSSVGFVRPSFVVRNKSISSQSSKIQSYDVLVEEIETNEKSYIEYETFLELERKSSSNVL